MDGQIVIEKVGNTPSGKTAIYEVQNASDVFLGEIRWYANWRRYVFFPDVCQVCLFDASCLYKIADFCTTLMEQYKEKRKK